MENKGVIIVALGHDNYIRMALNLAMSIRVSNPNTQIALVCNEGVESKFNYFEKQYFSKFIEINPKAYTINGKVEIPLSKTMIYELSPFDETIYIDSDSIWIKNKKVDNLFNTYKGVNFGFTLYHPNAHYPVDSDNSNFWFKEGETVRDLRKYFPKLKKDAYYYHLQSSFIYFKKSKQAEAIFNKAKDLFIKRDFEFRDWADSMPDELAFSLSLLNLDYKIDNPYKDIFYYPMSEVTEDGVKRGVKPIERSFIEKNYFFISMAGHVMNKGLKDLYNDHVKWNYAQHQNIKNPFLWIDKKDYLKERNKY
jgi:hypothetical protein